MLNTKNGLHVLNTLQRLLRHIDHPVARWVPTLFWTAVAASLMLSPSGDGTTVSGISKIFGGTEITDAIGHVLINIVLAFLWSWTISLYASSAMTLRVIVIGGLVWCFGAELLQHFVPERGTSLLDLCANILGVSIGVAVYWMIGTFLPSETADR